MLALDRDSVGAVSHLHAKITITRGLIDNSEGKIDERFQEQYERLLDIRNQLDRLSVTQAWSLRETDLFVYQRKLDRIDEGRINGNFVDADGKLADIHAQRVGRLNYCYLAT